MNSFLGVVFTKRRIYFQIFQNPFYASIIEKLKCFASLEEIDQDVFSPVLHMGRQFVKFSKIFEFKGPEINFLIKILRNTFTINNFYILQFM